MRKVVVLGVGAVLLGGCALPVPFQIASWALDGISMLATQKSVTDHGISLVTQQDCAVWRGVTQGELCRDNEPDDVLIVENVVKAPTEPVLKNSASFNSGPVLSTPRVASALAAQPAAQPRQEIAVRSSAIQVRAVPSHALRAAWTDSGRSVPAAAIATENTHALRSVPVKAVIQVASLAPQTVEPEPVLVKPESQVPVESQLPTKGIYFVIGSFRNPANAERLASNNEKLSPTVLSARLDGKKVYRVVVGPVPQGREKRLHRALTRSGFPDTWAIRVNPSDWQLANSPQPPSKAAPELALLQN